MVSFWVDGIPVSKGSARGIVNRRTGRVRVFQDNAAKQKPWARKIAVLAQAAGVVCRPGPVTVVLGFAFPRPAHHFGTGRNAAIVKPSADRDHVVKPDLDKLIRCVLDALTGVAWVDDSQVVGLACTKAYAGAGKMGGVMVSIQMGGLER